MAIRAALFDFGGVLSTSPFESFERYETDNGLPIGFIRQLNATNHEHNAWARFERNEVDLEEFCTLFEAEAEAAGGTLRGADVLACLSGDLRPEMIEAVRRCHERLKTALLTNNIAPMSEGGRMVAEVKELFDVVVESSVVGVRKPDPRFYEMALRELSVAADEAVFLDDLGINLKPAAALGIHTIKVTDPDTALAELEAAVGFPLRN